GYNLAIKCLQINFFLFCHLAVLFGNCEVTEQCKTPHTSCSTSGKCLCNFGYTFLYGEGCVQNPNKSTKEKNVYMAVLVVMTIIMFIVVGIIIIFLARRVICYGGGGQNNERPNDTLTINNQPGSVLSVDKPPTYEEVMDREEE
ncbi:uncharacterized protein LOC111084357, partial [Limulus polyphemus]|uniref:Uncharacterized protein LOC111084357 n=1 Tax=Limulus polyphemus TaxID=6850 RepID=A0ABM1RZJ6_LIMPO